ncbi:hypothetical protein C8N46_103334 [Kordia periserrulae]|uniref:Short-subunit dehydrogenase n=1 Tax=Kordia periserrulae TaxID=701523 RepID=A0A2T6C1N7_9FLAO|nr:SDR family NAD(P)-dependent oxidoreductase [Kordia periserrulae]PTX62234.1 hypothetical protein C8N46_103334 [Kordia periserrulae]
MALPNKLRIRLKKKYRGYALVTGASSGIGQELAKELATSGFDLILCARSEDKLNSLSAQWRGQQKIKIEVIATDLAKTEGVLSLLEQIEDKEIGMFIAAAGFGTSGNFIDNSIEEEVNMLRLNCEAVVMLTHQLAIRFKKQVFGGIVLFSSLVAFQGTPYAANYAATKAFIQTFAEGIAVELKSHHVDVLVVAPGPVKSGFGNRANMKMDGATPVEKIAVPILSALGRSSTVVPGAQGKFLTYSLRLLPRFGKIKVMKIVMGAMTKHQRTYENINS